MPGFLIDEDLPRSLAREPTVTLNTAIIEALRQVPGNDLPGNLLIIEPGRLRREHRPNAG